MSVARPPEDAQRRSPQGAGFHTRVARPPEDDGLPAYAELQCRSNFSFLEGASHPESLVARAAALGYGALALTDECSVAGVVRAWSEARRQDLHFVVGSTFVMDADAAPFELVVLCENREGYGNLAEMITLARSRAPKGEYHIGRMDFSAPGEPHAHLRGMPDCQVILAPSHGVADTILTEQLAWALAVFGDRLSLGLCLLHRPLDASHRTTLCEAAARWSVPLVAVGDVRMHLRSCKPVHDTLAAIRLGRPVQECGFALAANAEQHLRSRARLARLYPTEALARSVELARRCRFNLKDLRYQYPEEIVPVGHTPASYLREQTYRGAVERFACGVPRTLLRKIEHELQLIQEKQYEAYFLTVYDVVAFARRKGILCQGRGSAANSVVCFCLGITAADPQQTVPLFERFISRERDEPPDIDVDFEHQRREEVIQYIYRKYGRHRAALTAVVSSYRTRGVLRDTGKALGIDAGIIDAVAKAQQWWDGRDGMLQRMREAGLDAASPMARMWADLASRLHGFPRHLSQHPGGFVIACDNLSRMVPIENAAMPERSVVQWDKDDLDAVGLLKVDVLALGMLSVLRRALAFASTQRGAPLTLYQIPLHCDDTYAMIQSADTVGTFQIESRAQMSMLPRLRPACYYDLVVQVAIVRPGPIQGDMVHPYLRRRRGQEKHTVPRPRGLADDAPAPLDRALARTKGVPIFQEQVMQVAMIAGGFSAGRADSLRRSMAAWRRRGGIEGFRDELIDGMVAKGYEKSFAEAIFRQMEGFGEYGFPESHAASFALLAYASAWLKWHYPQAFLAALLNSQPMGFYSPSQLVQDARRAGVAVLPVDVACSGWEAAVVPLAGHAVAPEGAVAGVAGCCEGFLDADADDPRALRRLGVRLGLNQIRSLSEAAAQRVEAARASQPFTDVPDLARRAALSRHDVEALAAADALHGLVGNRRQAAWVAASATPRRDLLHVAEVGAVASQTTPRLAVPSEARQIVADYQALGLSLHRHPLALLREHLARQGYRPQRELLGCPPGRHVRGCGIVVGRQRPGTAKGTIFVTLEDETGPLNVIVWPKIAEAQRRALLGARLLGVHGVWQHAEGVSHLVARRLVDLTSLLGALDTSSRDFH